MNKLLWAGIVLASLAALASLARAQDAPASPANNAAPANPSTPANPAAAPSAKINVEVPHDHLSFTHVRHWHFPPRPPRPKKDAHVCRCPCGNPQPQPLVTASPQMAPRKFFP